MINNVHGRSTEKIYHFSFAEFINFQWGSFITVIVTLSFFEVLKSLYFDRLDGFVLINNLVCHWNGECNGFKQQSQG